jgi:hypothetical protein
MSIIDKWHRRKEEKKVALEEQRAKRSLVFSAVMFFERVRDTWLEAKENTFIDWKLTIEDPFSMAIGKSLISVEGNGATFEYVPTAMPYSKILWGVWEVSNPAIAKEPLQIASYDDDYWYSTVEPYLGLDSLSAVYETMTLRELLKIFDGAFGRFVPQQEHFEPELPLEDKDTLEINQKAFHPLETIYNYEETFRELYKEIDYNRGLRLRHKPTIKDFFSHDFFWALIFSCSLFNLLQFGLPIYLGGMGVLFFGFQTVSFVRSTRAHRKETAIDKKFLKDVLPPKIHEGQCQCLQCTNVFGFLAKQRETQ